MLPDALRDGIEEILDCADRSLLPQAAARISDAYRSGGAAAARAARTRDDVAAYLATRAPATYAAALETFHQMAHMRPDWAPRTLVDLGAGPGIATWAAAATWPTISGGILVEAEPEMARAGRSLAARGGAMLRDAEWTVADAGAARAGADLVIASYLIGELTPSTLDAFVARAWGLAADTLVIVEPGTTAGYERVLSARDSVVATGGFVLAPCPHEQS